MVSFNYTSFRTTNFKFLTQPISVKQNLQVPQEEKPNPWRRTSSSW